MLFQTSLGINIKDSTLSLVYLKASFKGVQLASQSVFSLDREKPVKERLESVSALIREFMKKNRISATNIFIGISRDVAIVRFVELPLAVKENLRETLGYEMEKYVPFSTEDIFFDSQIIGEDKETNKLGVILVVVRKEDLNNYIELNERLNSGGISGIEISSTAAANFFSQKTGSIGKDGLIMVDMTDDGLELNVIKERLLSYSRFMRIHWAVEDSYGLISRELKIIKDNYGPMRVSFSGPESDIEHFRHAIRDADLEEHLMDLSKTGIASHTLIPAYGLALKGIRKVPLNINLLPADLRKKASKAGLYVMFMLAGLLLLSVFFWGLGGFVQKRMNLERINSEIKSLSADIERIEGVKLECRALEEQIDYLNKLGPDRLSALDVLKELSERIPESAWLRKFSLTGDKIEIEGNAGSASELISLIEACPFFKDAAFLSPITKQRDGKEYFRIGFKLVNRSDG
ncbi:MAG: pilus assembly protein PilM [Deltaproteobacteria bacterium]|nr:pilus assembly protein PilM [Deltaproteobacteria bacterium]